MNWRYAFHPADSALGENEKYYGDMARRGWALVRRGSILSRFQRAQPARMRYRIEVAAPDFLEEQGLDAEQVAVYEDCGWSYVTSSGLLHIFRAPEDSPAPEFYLEPAQQAATLKALWRQYALSLVLAALQLGLVFLLGSSVGGGAGKTVSDALTDFQRAWVEETALWLLLVLAMLWSFTATLSGSWHIWRLRRQMKRGIPMDHAPRRRLLPRVLRYAATGCLVLFAALLAAQWLGGYTVPLPEKADGPYLVLADVGVVGQRTANAYNDKESQLSWTRSLLAQHWDTYEEVRQEAMDMPSVWFYQDIYRLSSPEMAEWFAHVLMEDSVFARSEERFSRRQIPGLDGVWTAENLECVAVKGELVCYLICSAYGAENADGFLYALAERWQEP